MSLSVLGSLWVALRCWDSALGMRVGSSGLQYSCVYVCIASLNHGICVCDFHISLHAYMHTCMHTYLLTQTRTERCTHVYIYTHTHRHRYYVNKSADTHAQLN